MGEILSLFHCLGWGFLGVDRRGIIGDLLHQPEIHALRDMDVAFVSMNQPYTTKVSAAANGVRALLPGLFIPVTIATRVA